MSAHLKQVLWYVVPSIGGMLASFLYTIVDGIFVGQGVGANALAAVNIALPFLLVLGAGMAMVTVGGATVTAIRLGRGDGAGANKAFVTSLLLSAAGAVSVGAIGVFFPETIARLSGASDALVSMAASYIRVFSLFALPYALGYTLSVFVRNDGNPVLAFWGMVLGAAANVFLDWLFVFPLQMGVTGAALASGLGQLLALLLLCFHFIMKKGQLRICKEKISLSLVGKVLERGFPEMVNQLNLPVTIFCYNFVILAYLGEMGVAAYSIIGYLTSLMMSIFFGVTEGVQPLIGQSFGMADKKQLNAYFKISMGLIVGLSVSAYLLFLFFGGNFAALFNSDRQLIALVEKALPIYLAAFPFAAASLMINTYLFSTKRTGPALVISACRGLSLNVACILLVPKLLGPDLLWLGLPLTEVLCFFISLALKKGCDARLVMTGHTTAD